MEIYKIKTKKKTMAASLLVSGNLQKCVCPFLIERESEKKKLKLNLGVLHHNGKKIIIIKPKIYKHTDIS